VDDDMDIDMSRGTFVREGAGPNNEVENADPVIDVKGIYPVTGEPCAIQAIVPMKTKRIAEENNSEKDCNPRPKIGEGRSRNTKELDKLFAAKNTFKVRKHKWKERVPKDSDFGLMVDKKDLQPGGRVEENHPNYPVWSGARLGTL
jgi:hypothetical protein